MNESLRFHTLKNSSRTRLLLLILLLTGLVGAAQAQEEQAGPPIPPTKTLKQEVTPSGVNTIIEISVSKDSFLSSAFPNTNFGGLNHTEIGYEVAGEGARRIVLEFDLSDIPDNVIINSAYLHYYLYQSIPADDAPMGFKAEFMEAPWGEYSVTWNNANYLGGPVFEIGEVSSDIGWHTNEATDAVRAWYNGTQPNYGVLITGDEAPERNRSRFFYSREAQGFSPTLIVDYTAACDILPPVATIQPLPAYSPGVFQVSWSGTDFAQAGCTPTGIDYYDVQYRVNGGSWVAWLYTTTDTMAIFPSGQNGNLYEFRVRAVDEAGNAQNFGDVQASTRVDTLPPAATVLPLPQYTFSNSFLVQWTGSDNLSGIASYDVQWRTAGGIWQTLLENTTQTAYQFTGGQNDVTYEFRARARDFVGNVQPFPEQAQAQTTVVAYPVARVLPFDPVILKPTAPITDSFTVNWTFQSGPTTPREARIYYRYDGGAWQLWDIFDYPQTSAEFPWEELGLSDGIYEFEAVAVNTLDQVEPRRMEAEAVIWVDMADVVETQAWLPAVIADQ